ncbi:MAG: glycerophosphodiester phosphodiesterase family protein [Parvularculales bacterium]
MAHFPPPNSSKGRPLVVAHRGGAGLKPENTLAAIETALEMEVDAIEVDVHLSADGVVVVHHNESLNPSIARGADGCWLLSPTPLIKNLTLSQLQRYDIGRLKPDSDYGAKFPHQESVGRVHIPTLDDVIETIYRLGRPSTQLFLELKTCLFDPARGADPKRLAAKAVERITHHNMIARTRLLSFNWIALLEARRLLPEIPNFFLTVPFALIDSARYNAPDGPYERMGLARTRPAPWAAGFNWQDSKETGIGARMAHTVARARDQGQADGWALWRGDLSPEIAAYACALGINLACWTVNETNDMTSAITHGVTAIITDRPDRLLDLLNSP